MSFIPLPPFIGMVSVAEKRNGNPIIAAYIRQVRACLAYLPSRQPNQVGDEAVEGWWHVRYQVQAEALEDGLNGH